MGTTLGICEFVGGSGRDRGKLESWRHVGGCFPPLTFPDTKKDAWRETPEEEPSY